MKTAKFEPRLPALAAVGCLLLLALPAAAQFTPDAAELLRRQQQQTDELLRRQLEMRQRDLQQRQADDQRRQLLELQMRLSRPGPGWPLGSGAAGHP